MVALIILLVAILITIFINRMATKALILTGLSKDVAEFQARSMTTGTGFTTHEAENIARHPTRRFIAMYLMLIQSVGMITVIATFVLSFVNTGSSGIAYIRAIILAGGLSILIFLPQIDWIDNQIEKSIDFLLEKYTNLTVRDYRTMLNLHKGYSISELTVDEDSWLIDNALSELKFQSENIMVLSIESTDGSVNVAPSGGDVISIGDKLILYGKEDGFENLKKHRGDQDSGKSDDDAEKE